MDPGLVIFGQALTFGAIAGLILVLFKGRG